MKTKEFIIYFICKKVDMEVNEKINLNIPLENSNLTSIKLIQLLTELETEIGFDSQQAIEDPNFVEMKTMQDLIDIVAKYSSKYNIK